MTAPATRALVDVVRDDSGCAVVTLNRPEALNALSSALIAELAGAIDALAADPGVRVLILTGAGRAFCAGLDLKELGAGSGLAAGGRHDGVRHDPVAAIERFPWPVIAAVNGPAVTGGFELALACDVILASPLARFADTHARVGLAPGWGLSQRLSRAIGPYRAREVSFSGNWVGAEQAAAWGFVNRVVPAERLLDEARALAADMLGAVPEALRHAKAIVNDGYALAFGDAMVLERRCAGVFNAAVPAADVEARRAGVRARNRGG